MAWASVEAQGWASEPIGGNPDLVSGGAPTNGSQAKASGTTSSDAITFIAPTGGSGASTPSVALVHVVGAGATVAPGGASLGPHTISGLEDGDTVRLTCTHTDDGDGQVIEDVAVVAVAVASPTVSVADRDPGQSYDVAIGGRSITITASAGATLLTTVVGDATGSISVTGSTTTTPSWTHPSNDACSVRVVATLRGRTAEVTFTEWSLPVRAVEVAPADDVAEDALKVYFFTPIMANELFAAISTAVTITDGSVA